MISFWKLPATGVALTALAVMPHMTHAADHIAVALTPANMKPVGTIDERYQSYNVEMLEVTGGKFWKPYKDISKLPSNNTDVAAESSDVPAGMSADLYQYRQPLALENRRLRAMAKALAPAYMRVSGTWANTTYFDDSETPLKDPPEGYGGVLTRQQWLAAIDFSRAVDAPIVTSMPTSVGTRDAKGLWRPEQARRWLAFTKAHGGTVAAAEYMNEPTLAAMGGAPKGYDAAAFGRDYRVFNAFMRKEYPDTKLLAPGPVGEANADWAVAVGGYVDMETLPAGELAKSTTDADAFSYHHYGAVSQRCANQGFQTSADQALSEDWLSRTDKTLAYYRDVRDQHMPGKPFWNTETADAACGGNPWGSTFLDTFRYLDQLGRLARQEVDVLFHNTLVASDYGLLDEDSFEPKPSFWGAVLWRRLMGTTVLDTGVANRAGMHVYAHCLRGTSGGVAMLILNTDRQKTRSLTLPVAASRYTLAAENLTDKTVLLNNTTLQLGPNDVLPAMDGSATAVGELKFAPATITFLAIPLAKNVICQ